MAKFSLYTLPGGGVEPGEDIVHALHREILEETGCPCTDVQELGIVRENRACHDFTQRSHYYSVTLGDATDAPHLTPKEQSAGAGVVWCTWQELLHLITDPKHETEQRRFIQARDIAALDEYARRVELYVPNLNELSFRREMMASPATMSYNIGWDVDYDGYHRDTGCIDFPESEWQSWYSRWVGQEPERYYAYIRRVCDGELLGEVCFHRTPEKNWHDMGVVIHAPFRGRGYSRPALEALLRHAFADCGVERIHNDFEPSRGEGAALRLHLAAGFRETGREDGLVHLMLTRDEYLSGK